VANLYKDPFEFLPTHKLQIFTNFTPAIKSQDFAMWRRILLLNYPNSYGDQIQVQTGDANKLGDPHLDNALKAEASGVLAWLVQGAKEWYASRLQPPKAVLEATHKYRADQDIIGQFAHERLVVDETAWVALAGAVESVFPSYQAWCKSMNCRALGRTRFIRELQRVTSATVESRGGIPGFKGIKLTSTELLD
jgi:putative DNA primase/helicase